MITKTFTSTDQLNAEGKVVDKIFTINAVENIEYSSSVTYSGTELVEKIKELENKKSILDKQVLGLTEEINFLKTIK